MKCQNCDEPVLFADERCGRCGAKLLHRRVFPGASKGEDFTLTTDDPQFEREAPSRTDDWEFDSPPEFAPIPPGISAPSAPVLALRWGGFFRRVAAFLVDVVIVLLLSMLMGMMSFIGYKVGLAAHDRIVSVGNAGPLVLFLTFGWIFLTTAYFVVFHGMDGRTIGKRLFGLRVVSAEQTPVTYRQAFLRCFGLVVAVVPMAAGIFWILLNREKRGWHDLIARTWVVRD
jgi:uncharacterized RDD family membrane protein YckC